MQDEIVNGVSELTFTVPTTYGLYNVNYALGIGGNQTIIGNCTIGNIYGEAGCIVGNNNSNVEIKILNNTQFKIKLTNGSAFYYSKVGYIRIA